MPNHMEAMGFEQATPFIIVNLTGGRVREGMIDLKDAPFPFMGNEEVCFTVFPV